MKTIKITLIILSIHFCFYSSAQKWISTLQPKDGEMGSFYDIQRAFYEKHQDQPIEDYLKEYKKFKRWEWYMEQRVDNSGYLPTRTLWSENQKTMNTRQFLQNNADWNCIGPFGPPIWKVNNAYNGTISGAGRVECIEFHPSNPDIMWIGTHSGGFWKTTDGGVSWFTTSNELPSLGISDIVVDPSNPDVLYVGTGDRDTDYTFSIGLLKSLDGGESFQETGLNYIIQDQEVITEIIIDPNNSDILIVSTTEGIYKSTDGALNWNLVQAGNFRDMVVKPGDQQVIYASTYGYNGGAEIYKSANQGDSFEVINNTGVNPYQVSRITIAVTPVNPELVYFVCSKVSGNQSGLKGIYKSDDSGDSWSEIVSSSDINLLGRSVSGNDTEGYGWYTLSLAVSPVDPDLIFVGGINTWRSIDGGENWEIKTTEIPNLSGVSFSWVDQHEIRINPLNQIVYLAHDGGVYKSENNGDTFEDISQNLNIMQMYKLGCSPTNEDIIVAGCQDQFGMLYNEGVWEATYTGEASEHFVSNDDPNTLFCYGFGFGMIRSTNRGYSYSSINPPGMSKNFWLIPTISHPHFAHTIYVGAQGIYKSCDEGNTWETLIGNLSNSYALNTIEVAFLDDNYIYTCSQQRIWKSVDGGQNWINITYGLPDTRYITDIAVSEIDPLHVWISLSKFIDGEKVFESIDGGETWNNVSSNLPNVPVNTIIYSNDGYDGIYVGSDIGVFYTNKQMNAWEDFSTNLPNVIVSELEIHKLSGKIRAATHGRGLWESPLYDNSLLTLQTKTIQSFSIAPNPVKNQLQISYNFINQSNGFILIKNMEGKAVLSFEQTFTKGNQHTTIDVSNLASGFYIVECVVDNKTCASAKMIKF